MKNTSEGGGHEGNSERFGEVYRQLSEKSRALTEQSQREQLDARGEAIYEESLRKLEERAKELATKLTQIRIDGIGADDLKSAELIAEIERELERQEALDAEHLHLPSTDRT